MLGFLRAQKPYTKHQQYRGVKKYRKVYAKRARYLIQMDLLEFRKYAPENRDYNYILCAIDAFTKKLWTFPLRGKRADDVHNAVFYFLMRERPEKIQTDQGTEFINATLRATEDRMDPPIQHYHTWSIKKASIVERVQRTLRNRLGKIWEQRGDHQWIDVLPDITESYNNSVHRSIGMRPNDVGPEHHQLIYDRLYPEPTPAQALKDAREARRLTEHLQVGDYVRILEYRKLFRKESDLAWTHEVFRIRHVIRSNPITFQIEDLDGDPIKGGFYARELIKVRPSDDEFDGVIQQPPRPGRDIVRNRYETRVGRRVESEDETDEEEDTSDEDTASEEEPDEQQASDEDTAGEEEPDEQQASDEDTAREEELDEHQASDEDLTEEVSEEEPDERQASDEDTAGEEEPDEERSVTEEELSDEDTAREEEPNERQEDIDQRNIGNRRIIRNPYEIRAGRRIHYPR